METTLSPHASMAREQRAGRLRFLVPIAALIGLVVTFGWALNRDPSTIPSALIGQRVPQFALPAVQGRTLSLSSADLIGEVSLVNVFASWCVACREEHPVFMRLKAEGIVPVYGMDYKDKPEDAVRWLATM